MLKNDFQTYAYRTFSGTVIDYDDTFVISSKSQSPTESIQLPEVSAGPYKIWVEVKDISENVGYSDTVTVWFANDSQSIIDINGLNSDGKLTAAKGQQLQLDGFISDPISFSGDGGFHDFKVSLLGQQSGIIYNQTIDIVDPSILISLGDFVDHADFGGGIDIPSSLTDSSLTLSIFVIDVQSNLTFRKIEVVVQQ
jgi:hypothetical protein